MNEIVKPKCQILTDFNQGNRAVGAPFTRAQFAPPKGIAISGLVFKLISTYMI